MSSLRGYGMALSAHQKPTVGDIKYSAARESHLGWLLCDGSELLIKEYGFLYNVIGTSFGSPSLSTKFKLPNPAGLVPTSVGSYTDVNSHDRIFALGDISGEYMHKLSIPEMPIHNHDITDVSGTTTTIQDNEFGITDASGGHTHTITQTPHTHSELIPVGDLGIENDHPDVFGNNNASNSAETAGANADITIDPVVDHSHRIRRAGGDQYHNNIQPTIAMGNMFIYSGLPRAGKYPYTANTDLF